MGVCGNRTPGLLHLEVEGGVIIVPELGGDPQDTTKFPFNPENGDFNLSLPRYREIGQSHLTAELHISLQTIMNFL